jgi:hypothetical protein
MSDVSGGPGWWQASDNKWYPPELLQGAELPPSVPSVPPPPVPPPPVPPHRTISARTLYAMHRGANATSTVFKVLAIVLLVVGALAAYGYAEYLHDHTSISPGGIALVVVGLLSATVIYASVSAFFGYVVDLLVQIEGNTRETAYNQLRGDLPSPPTRRT